MLQKGEHVTVKPDIIWAEQLHGIVGKVAAVWPSGEQWTYAVQFGDEGEVMMYGFELDRAPKAE